jgi:hypothetical protein
MQSTTIREPLCSLALNSTHLFLAISDRLRLAEEKVQAFRSRIDQRKPENYGFASMAAVPYAHVVADLLQNKKPKGATITLAPDPKDIVRDGTILRG